MVPCDDHMAAIIAAQASDSLTVDISVKLLQQTATDGKNTIRMLSQWSVIAVALNYEKRTYMSAVNSLCRNGINVFCENLDCCLVGALKTTQLVSRDFYWLAMDWHVPKYVS